MREKISKSDFFKRYNSEYWIKIYAQIRMAEVGQSKNIKQMKRLMKEISLMNKKLDLENLMMYIDTNIRKFDGRFLKTKSGLITSAEIKKSSQDPSSTVQPTSMGGSQGSSGGSSGY